jgi:hypothetical protein
MTDADRCKLIAEFEGIYPNDILTSDYPHDLNATMRAARKLPKFIYLEVSSSGRADIKDIASGPNKSELIERAFSTHPIDCARAAFFALSAYIELNH